MPGPDKRAVARAFRRVARGYASADFLHREIRARLLERLDFMSLTPGVVLDLGAGPPEATAELRARFPESRLLALDLVPEMLGGETPPWYRAAADAARLPLPDQSVDLIVAGMLLHWCEEPERVLAEARRVLRFPGVLLLSTLGPDSLKELRAAWAETDSHDHVLDFADMHNLGDSLVRAGFAEPVIGAEPLTVTYRELASLVRDLRSVGASHIGRNRRRTLTGKGRWTAMAGAFERQRRADGSLPVTVEAICAHAWASPPRPEGGASPGEFAVPLARLRRRP